MESEEAPFPIGEAPFEEAFNQLLPRFRELAPSEVVGVNCGIPVVVPIALAVESRPLELNQRILHELPGVERALADELRVHALALSHAHTLYRMAAHASDSLEALAAEGMKLRAVLFADASALVKRGLVDAGKLHGFRGSVGYRKLAFGLLILAQVFRDCPVSVWSRGPRRLDEIERAERIAAAILKALGARKMGPAAIEVASDLRNRAFTLFVRVYGEVRRVVTFLRWHEGDANEIAPSLCAKRKGGSPSLVRSRHVTLQESDVGLVAERLAPAPRGVGRSPTLHRDQVVLGDDVELEIAELHGLRTLDDGIEPRVERELHGFAAGVLEVDAVRELALETEAACLEGRREGASLDRGRNGKIDVERRTGDTATNADREPPDQRVRDAMLPKHLRCNGDGTELVGQGGHRNRIARCSLDEQLLSHSDARCRSQRVHGCRPTVARPIPRAALAVEPGRNFWLTPQG